MGAHISGSTKEREHKETGAVVRAKVRECDFKNPKKKKEKFANSRTTKLCLLAAKNQSIAQKTADFL